MSHPATRNLHAKGRVEQAISRWSRKLLPDIASGKTGYVMLKNPFHKTQGGGEYQLSIFANVKRGGSTVHHIAEGSKEFVAPYRNTINSWVKRNQKSKSKKSSKSGWQKTKRGATVRKTKSGKKVYKGKKR